MRFIEYVRIVAQVKSGTYRSCQEPHGGLINTENSYLESILKNMIHILLQTQSERKVYPYRIKCK